MKHQKGQIFRSGKNWYGRWRRDELVSPKELSKTERRELEAKGVLKPNDSSKILVRRQHCEKLAEYGDRYRSKKDVQPILDTKLLPANDGREDPKSTLSVTDYAENYFLPYTEKELKKSTAYGYQQIFRIYLKARLTSIALRDFRCVDATNLLADIHEHHRIGKKSLRHCKALLSTIFMHAKRAGVLDGANPVADAGIPRAAKASAPTYAYSAEEVLAMLDALTGVAKTAIALMFFAGLRPGESRAMRWSDYDGKILRVRQSMWRLHVSEPKTNASIASVPVCQTLREVLEESPRQSEFVLCSPNGKRPVDLHNLASRVIVPRLLRCAKCDKAKKGHDEKADHAFEQLPVWRGYYSLRRGCATLVTSLDSALAAKGLLRHTDLATTSKHYIKDIPIETLRAAEKMDALFQKSSSSAPN